MSTGKKTLYERLGGNAITAVANDLLPRLRADPQLGRFWAHRGEDGVMREKQLLIDFLCASVASATSLRCSSDASARSGRGAPDAWPSSVGVRAALSSALTCSVSMSNARNRLAKSLRTGGAKPVIAASQRAVSAGHVSPK